MKTTRATDEAAICDVIERWARAVRAKDLHGILAYHSPEMLMFDVPPPMHSRGIDASQQTWGVFFAWSQDSGVFNIEEMDVTAGDAGAFVTALMRCAGTEPDGEKVELQFRLTIGLHQIDSQWTVVHEQPSIPAT
jgi:ketosteroid isomerase-like protein